MIQDKIKIEELVKDILFEHHKETLYSLQVRNDIASKIAVGITGKTDNLNSWGGKDDTPVAEPINAPVASDVVKEEVVKEEVVVEKEKSTPKPVTKKNTRQVNKTKKPVKSVKEIQKEKQLKRDELKTANRRKGSLKSLKNK